MLKLIEMYYKIVQSVILGIVILFIIVGIHCAIDAYGDTWTIDDGKFKSIYDNKEDCMRNKIGTGTSDVCDDETQVIYRDK